MSIFQQLHKEHLLLSQNDENSIYSDKNGTLFERLDYAWKVYKSKELKYTANYKKAALAFLRKQLEGAIARTSNDEAAHTLLTLLETFFELKERHSDKTIQELVTLTKMRCMNIPAWSENITNDINNKEILSKLNPLIVQYNQARDQTAKLDYLLNLYYKKEHMDDKSSAKNAAQSTDQDTIYPSLSNSLNAQFILLGFTGPSLENNATAAIIQHLKKKKVSLRDVPLIQKNDVNVILTAYPKDPTSLKFAGKEAVIHLLTKQQASLADASEEHKADKDVVFAAYKANILSLQFAGTIPISQLLQEGKVALKDIPDTHKNDRQIVLAVYQNECGILSDRMDYAWMIYQGTPILYTLEQQKKARQFLMQTLKIHEEPLVDKQLQLFFNYKTQFPNKDINEIRTYMRMETMKLPTISVDSAFVKQNSQYFNTQLNNTQLNNTQLDFSHLLVEIEQDIEHLNSAIETYNVVPPHNEHKLACLQKIYQLKKTIEHKYPPDFTGAWENYRRVFQVQLFNDLKDQFALLGIHSLNEAVLFGQPKTAGTAGSTPPITIEQILADMSTDKIATLTKYLVKDKWPKLYDSLDTSTEAQNFKKFFDEHSIRYVGGGNSKNFQITSSNGSSCVLKIENRLNQPKNVEDYLRSGALSTHLTPVTAERQVPFIDTKHNKLTTRTILVTSFCSGGNLLDHTAAKGADFNARIKAVFNIYHQVGELLIKTQEAGCVFTDAKNTNFLLSRDKNNNDTVLIADTKAFMFVNKSDGKFSYQLPQNKWLGQIKSKNIWSPEFDTSLPFSADKLHVRQLGIGIYQYLTKCPECYLIRENYAEYANDYDFQYPIFQTSVGKQLKELITQMTHPFPDARIPLKAALSRFKGIMRIHLQYEHATLDELSSRPHKFSAAPGSLINYQGYKGDVLKTKILMEAKEAIQACKSEDDILQFQARFKQQIDILKLGQGDFTRDWGIETTSIKAFNKMLEEKITELRSLQSSLTNNR